MALVGCVVAVLALALFHGPKAKGHTPVRPGALAERTFRRLVAEALDAPALPGGWARGNLRVLSRRVSGEGVWRLAYLETRERICWALLVPRVTQEGSCGGLADVRRRPFIVYTGTDPSGVEVVYGLVSPKVASLRLRLSDCSESRVSLGGRPLFWTLLPRGAAARSYRVALRGGRVAEGRLLSARAREACAAAR